MTPTTSRTGHCLCGAITYRFDAEPTGVVLCHCDDCQRHTGSAFSQNVLVVFGQDVGSGRFWLTWGEPPVEVWLV